MRIWAAKTEASEFDDDLAAANSLQEDEARIGALSDWSASWCSRTSFLRGFAARSPATSVVAGPVVSSAAQGCPLMGLARSTYYDEPAGQPIEEARLVECIKEICVEWPSYG